MRLSARGGPGKWLGALALAVSLIVAGCGGGGKGTVTGKVTYKGQALKGGRVSFAASNKQTVLADIKEDGTYTAPDVATGPAKVSVQTSYMKQLSRTSRSYKVPEGAPPGLGGRDPDLAKRYVQIPDNYEDPEKSGLTYDVKRGSQDHNIELK
jgi:hypothetical protein